VRDKLQRESSLLPMRASLRGMSPSGAEPGPEGKSLDSPVSSTGQA